MEINRQVMEEALQYLAGTDEQYAKAKSLFDGLCEQRKTVKAQWFLRSPESSAAAKMESAYNSTAYKQHLEKMEAAQVEFLTLQAKRITQSIVVDCWRSLNSARSKGQVV